MPDPTPIRDAVAKIGSDGLDVRVDTTDGQDITVTGQVQKSLGKGWTWAGAVQWTKSQWSAWTGVSWRPK